MGDGEIQSRRGDDRVGQAEGDFGQEGIEGGEPPFPFPFPSPLLIGPPPLSLDFRERGGGGGGGGGEGEGCTAAIVDALRRDGGVDGCCARWERRQQRGDDDE